MSCLQARDIELNWIAGERLPKKFFKRATHDFPLADLLIVMGTSLVVKPFASLIGRSHQSEKPQACLCCSQEGKLGCLPNSLNSSDGFEVAGKVEDMHMLAVR